MKKLTKQQRTKLAKTAENFTVDGLKIIMRNYRSCLRTVGGQLIITLPDYAVDARADGLGLASKIEREFGVSLYELAVLTPTWKNVKHPTKGTRKFMAFIEITFNC